MQQSSMWSQAGWVVSVGGLLGMLMSVAYYRALGPPRLWVETCTAGRGGGCNSGGSGGGGDSRWWFRNGEAGGFGTRWSSSRHTVRNLGSLGGRFPNPGCICMYIRTYIYICIV